MNTDLVSYQIKFLPDINLQFEYELLTKGRYIEYKLIKFTLSSFKERNETILNLLAALRDLIVSPVETESYKKFTAYNICFMVNIAIIKMNRQDFILIKQTSQDIIQELISDIILTEHHLQSIISLINFVLKGIFGTKDSNYSMREETILQCQLIQIMITFIEKGSESDYYLSISITNLCRNSLELAAIETNEKNIKVIIQSLSKAYYCIRDTSPSCIYFVLEVFVYLISKVSKINFEYSRNVFGIFYDAFTLRDVYNQTPKMIMCLRFFIHLSNTDTSPLYFKRNSIIDYLSSIYLEKFDNEAYRYAIMKNALELISNLIDRWSNQAYIMLDTLGINKMIEDCKNDEMNVELNRLAEKLAANVVGFKANLRRFYVVNGYPKKLN